MLILGPIHHIALRVIERDRPVTFYQASCDFQVVMALPDMTLLDNDMLLLGLRDQPCAGSDDHFNEFRVGLDRLNVMIASRAELDGVAAILEQHQIEHGEIEDMRQASGWMS